MSVEISGPIILCSEDSVRRRRSETGRRLSLSMVVHDSMNWWVWCDTYVLNWSVNKHKQGSCSIGSSPTTKMGSITGLVRGHVNFRNSKASGSGTGIPASTIAQHIARPIRCKLLDPLSWSPNSEMFSPIHYLLCTSARVYDAHALFQASETPRSL